MKSRLAERLTTPDLLLLTLLAEQPMHGYQVNSLLESRKVRDWAGISRPQVYYSFDKLARLGLIAIQESEGEKAGPKRRVFVTTEQGKAALGHALEREDWTEDAGRPAFLTWLSLSARCGQRVFDLQLHRRQEFLRQELGRKQRILQDALKEVGHPFHERVWMLSLSIEQIRTELAWLEQVGREAPNRARAKKPVSSIEG
jgi:DNA-binding PadR family transcriptional regulator